MATYMQLKGLQNDSDLQDKVEVSCWRWAQAVLVESAAFLDHDKRVTMARRVFEDSLGISRSVIRVVLAANASATVTAIQAATDSSVQGEVDKVLDAYATDLRVAGTE